MPLQPTGEEYVPAPDVESALKADFPYLSMSPEEYVARHSHNIGAFAIWRWQFRDSVFATWLRGVHENLHDRAKREACRERFLTREEREHFRELEQGAF